MDYIIDVFSCEDDCYLSPPDVDVNTICWDGTEFVTWFEYTYEDEQYYSNSFDIDDIIERCKNKEAIALTREWISDDDPTYMKERLDKLRTKGWNIVMYILSSLVKLRKYISDHLLFLVSECCQ